MDDLDPTDASTWPEHLTPEQASSVLRITVNQVRKLLAAGELRGKKLGGRWYVLKRPLLYPDTEFTAGDVSGESAAEDAPPE